jgi:hypothetical protein
VPTVRERSEVNGRERDVGDYEADGPEDVGDVNRVSGGKQSRKAMRDGVLDSCDCRDCRDKEENSARYEKERVCAGAERLRERGERKMSDRDVVDLAEERRLRDSREKKSRMIEVRLMRIGYATVSMMVGAEVSTKEAELLIRNWAYENETPDGRRIEWTEDDIEVLDTKRGGR